jgi:hypothetical protein
MRVVLAAVLEARGSNVSVPQPLLHFGNVGIVCQGRHGMVGAFTAFPAGL